MNPAEDAPIDDETPCDECPCNFPEPEFENEFESMDRNDRAWLRTLYPFLELALKPNRAEVDERVGLAIGRAVIAASERVSRICRSDVDFAVPLDDPHDMA